MRATRGFTLPELLIVITVLAVLVGVGLPSFGEFIRNQRVKTASFDLFSTLVLARNEAITRDTKVTITPAAANDWTKGWTVAYTDAAGNTVPLRVQEAVTNISVTGPGSVEYRGSGRLGTNMVQPVRFEVKTTGGTAIARCISIDPSGRAHTKATTC
jgi:type IV fimbrial biogenesis protein FimT